MADTYTVEAVTQEELRRLIQETQWPTLSLFQPTHRGGPEYEQDHLRFKNLVNQADGLFSQRGVARPQANEVLSPVRKALDDRDLWWHRHDGLALFSAPGHFSCYRLPIVLDEGVHIGDSAYVKPLLPAVVEGHFYLLVLSMGSARLLRATRYAVEEIDLGARGVPASLDEAFAYDDYERGDLPRHPTAGGGDGGRRSVPGHGPDKDMKEEIARYFKALDTGIAGILATETTPLVIAGVDYLHPLYKGVSSYRHIHERGLVGNFDNTSIEAVHARAVEIMKPHFRSGLEAARARFGSGASSGTASCALGEVLGASYGGRVDALLVRAGDESWGVFDPASGVVEAHDSPDAADVDLVDLAARQTLLHGGATYAVEPDHMPCDAPLAAVFRY